MHYAHRCVSHHLLVSSVLAREKVAQATGVGRESARLGFIEELSLNNGVCYKS